MLLNIAIGALLIIVTTRIHAEGMLLAVVSLAFIALFPQERWLKSSACPFSSVSVPTWRPVSLTSTSGFSLP